MQNMCTDVSTKLGLIFKEIGGIFLQSSKYH